MKEGGTIRMVNLNCNHCGGSIDVDLDNLITYCPFCGQKLMIDVSSMQDILKEKEKTKQKGLRYQRDVEVIDIVKEAKAEKQKRNNLMLILVMIFMMILILLSAYLGGMFQ